MRLVWPEDMKLKVQQANVPSSAAVRTGGQTSLEIALDDVQPLIVPKGAPLRFSVGRYGEASDAFRAALQHSRHQALMTQLDLEPFYRDGEAFRRYLQAQLPLERARMERLKRRIENDAG